MLVKHKSLVSNLNFLKMTTSNVKFEPTHAVCQSQEHLPRIFRSSDHIDSAKIATLCYAILQTKFYFESFPNSQSKKSQKRNVKKRVFSKRLQDHFKTLHVFIPSYHYWNTVYK